ncbi:MAG: class I SAM-dependent methyltransferase [Syntrophobacteraceae bacterium]
MNDDWLPMPRYRLRKDLVRKVLQHENLVNKTCLELGYGSGDMLLLYAELGLRAYGFDISEEALRHASTRIGNQPPLIRQRITLIKEKAQIDEKRFDYIMAFEVLEHIEDDAACLGEWWNTLGEGGRLLISVPAHLSKWGANDVATGHYRRYEKQALMNLLADSGFKVLYSWNYAYPLSILLDIFLQRGSGVESEDSLSKEELSKQSGINRKKNLVNRFVSSGFFLSPFLFMQRFFLNKDWSSAYLICAEKAPGKSPDKE